VAQLPSAGNNSPQHDGEIYRFPEGARFAKVNNTNTRRPWGPESNHYGFKRS